MSATAQRPDLSAQPGVLPRLAVLFEPTSVEVFELVEAARDTWETVWLVDFGAAGLGNLPRLLARFGEVVDITGLDPAQVKATLRARPVDGLITFEDSQLVRGALIAEELGLAFYSPETARRLTDKYAQRQAFREAGIPTPRSVLLPAGAGADLCRAVADEVTFPVVVKPSVGKGSTDVFAVDDVEHLVALFDSGSSRLAHQDMVVEERIPDGWPRAERAYADMVSVESLVSAGCVSHFCVTGRTPLAEPFRETGLFLPSNLSPAEAADVTRAAEQAIAALGARIGAFHTEVKLTPGGCRVVEVNGRLGGGVAQLASLVTDVSLLNAAGRVALGEDVDVSDPEFSGVAYDQMFQPPVGRRTIVAIEGLDALRALPGTSKVETNLGPGDSVQDWARGSAGYVYLIRGRVDTHEDLWAMLDTVRETVQVTYGP